MQLITFFTTAMLATAMASPLRTSTMNNVTFEHSLVPREQVVTVALGQQKEIVGDLQGGALYDSIYGALEQLCPEGKPQCVTMDKQAVYFPMRFKSPHDILSTKMRISVERSAHSKDQIRRLLIGTVAGAVEAMITDIDMERKNCKEIWIGPGGHGYFKS